MNNNFRTLLDALTEADKEDINEIAPLVAAGAAIGGRMAAKAGAGAIGKLAGKVAGGAVAKKASDTLFDEDVEQMYIVKAKSPFWKTMHYVKLEGGANIMKGHIKHASPMSEKHAQQIADGVEGGPNKWVAEIEPHNELDEAGTNINRMQVKIKKVLAKNNLILDDTIIAGVTPDDEPGGWYVKLKDDPNDEDYVFAFVNIKTGFAILVSDSLAGFHDDELGEGLADTMVTHKGHSKEDIKSFYDKWIDKKVQRIYRGKGIGPILTVVHAQEVMGDVLELSNGDIVHPSRVIVVDDLEEGFFTPEFAGDVTYVKSFSRNPLRDEGRESVDELPQGAKKIGKNLWSHNRFFYNRSNKMAEDVDSDVYESLEMLYNKLDDK